VAIALSGCASENPKDDSQVTAPESGESSTGMEAAWLDGGRMIGVITQGSSSCVPFAKDVTAKGQEITVTLSDTIEGQEDRPCTADYTARASAVGVPEGVDPREDVTIHVNYGDQKASLELDGESGLTGAPGTPTDYLPSAAWVQDDLGIVLLTWGSSTCLPVIGQVDETDTAITVNFNTIDGACTMDMVPRLTMIGLTNKNDDRTLTLAGGGLDGAVTVI
jgi:hypothetical protein